MGYFEVSIMLRFFLLFTIIPAFEIWLLIKIGGIIGGFETIFLIILTGVVGANLTRKQGIQVLAELNNALQTGKSPAKKVTEGLLILGGGILLITPGVCTDIIGLCVMIPPFRAAIAEVLQNILLKRIQMGSSPFMNQNTGNIVNENEEDVEDVSNAKKNTK